MTKVTNKHSAPLNVAGTDVRPGATVNVDDNAFTKWSNGHAAKTWLKLGLIESDGKKPKTDNKVNTAGQPTNRDALAARAAANGIEFSDETSDEDLLKAVEAAEAEANKEDDRDALLKEARELGLNPNANISTPKLKQQIADKKLVK